LLGHKRFRAANGNLIKYLISTSGCTNGPIRRDMNKKIHSMDVYNEAVCSGYDITKVQILLQPPRTDNIVCITEFRNNKVNIF
jgi:hypothetical protein